MGPSPKNITCPHPPHSGHFITFIEWFPLRSLHHLAVTKRFAVADERNNRRCTVVDEHLRKVLGVGRGVWHRYDASSGRRAGEFKVIRSVSPGSSDE